MKPKPIHKLCTCLCTMLLTCGLPQAKGQTRTDGQPQAGIQACETVRTAGAPRWAVKTNLAAWGTASLNAAGEVRMSDKTSLNLGLSYNPWTYKDNKKWKHILVQPEVRYWLCAPFGGHFVGGHLIYSHYNAGGTDLPDGIWKSLKDNRFQGDLYGVGVVYGYDWIVSPHWNIEAALGLGYGFTRYKQYECRTCGNFKGTFDKHLFLPTKVALSFVYIIK